MKHKVILFFVIILAVLSSCSKNDYLNVIPKDATYVSSVNMANIAQKGELGESPLMDMAKGYMGIMLSKDAQETVKSYMEDPREMGIDFTAPIYIFKTPAQAMGVTMKVGSDDKLEGFLKLLQDQNMCSKPVERDGMFTGTILDDIDFAYNDNTFLLVMSLNDGGSAVRLQQIIKLFEQEKDDSFLSTEAYEKMDDDKKDIIIYSNLAAVPIDYAMTVKSLVPNGVKLADVEIFASLAFQDGRAVLSSEINGKTESAQKALDEANKHFRKIEGRYIDSPSENFFVWGCAGVDGNWLLNTLKQDVKIKQMLFLVERAIDIEQIIRSVDGDLSVVLPSTFVTGNSANSVIDFIATAKIKDEKFLDDVPDWKQSMKEYNIKMIETGKNNWVLSGGDMKINWGVDDDNVYIATSDAFNSNAFSKRSQVLKDYESEIKDNLVFIYMNLSSLPLKEVASVIQVPGMASRLTALKALVIKSPSAHKMEMVLELKDQKTNFLKQMF